MRIHNIYADENGETHFRDIDIEMSAVCAAHHLDDLDCEEGAADQVAANADVRARFPSARDGFEGGSNPGHATTDRAVAGDLTRKASILDPLWERHARRPWSDLHCAPSARASGRTYRRRA